MKFAGRASHAERANRLARRFLEHRSEGAFRRLYRHCTPALYGMVFRLINGNEAAAQEIVQETWIRAVQGFGRFRWESRFETWLAGIAVRISQEWFRECRLNSRQIASLETTSPKSTAVSEPVDLDLEMAIARLPEGCREVLILHEVEGYTHLEIGDMLGISAGTSKSQLFHARRLIRRTLTEQPASGGSENVEKK